MPNRVLRADLLDSERYWSLPTDSCRMLFTHLLLRADDLGLFKAANYTIRATCFGLDPPTPETVARMLHELERVDLVRFWKSDGIEYGFVPRFGQRLRIVKSKFPLPPANIRDSEINEIISKMTDGRQTHVGHPSVEVKRNESKRKEKKGVVVTPTITREPQPAKQINTVLSALKFNNETEEQRQQRIEAERERQLAIVRKATDGKP